MRRENVTALATLLPPAIAQMIRLCATIPTDAAFSAVLVEPPDSALLNELALRPGPIPLVQSPGPDGRYRLDWLVEEITISTNTTAAGGNASLMALV